jgi:hypothetical protein
MRTIQTLLRTALWLLLLPVLAVAQETSFGSPEDQRNLIAGICGTQLNIGPEACTCLADRAMTELDEPQRTYLILSAVQPATAETLPIAGLPEQLALIFGFLEKAGTECRDAAAEGDADADGDAAQ